MGIEDTSKVTGADTSVLYNTDSIYIVGGDTSRINQADVGALYTIAIKLYKVDKTRYVGDLLSTCISRGLEKDSCYYMLGKCLYGQDSLQVYAYEKAISLNPSFNDLYEKLGDIYFRRAKIDRYDTTIKDYKTSLDTATLGKSIKYYSKAISLQPDNSWPYGHLALALFLNNDREGAKKNADKGLALDKGNYLATYVLRFLSGDRFIDPLDAR